MFLYSYFIVKFFWIFDRVGVREIGLRLFLDCIGCVFGIGDINDCFYDFGNNLVLNEWLNNLVIGYVSLLENFFNIWLRILFGLVVLEILIFVNLDLIL